MKFLLRQSPGNTRGPVYTESLLRTLHRIDRRSDPVCLGIETLNGEVVQTVECPRELRSLLSEELQDAYQGLQAHVIRQEGRHANDVTWSRQLRLSPDVFRLRTYDQFMDEPERMLADPLLGLMSSVRTGKSGRVRCAIRLMIRPASGRQVRRLQHIEQHLQRLFRSTAWRDRYARWACRPVWLGQMAARLLLRLTSRAPETPTRASSKAAQPLFACCLVIECTSPADAGAIATRKLAEMTAALGRLHSEAAQFVGSNRERGVARRTTHRGSFLLTPREIATLWHPPVESAQSVSRLAKSEFRELEPPLRISSKEGRRDVTLLGRVKYRRQREQFGIAADDLRRHLIAVGKTGCGKSTFLQHVVLQQITQGRGVVLIDPHGQLVDDVLDHIPRRRTNDVVLFDAADRQHPVRFNPLQGPQGSDPTLIADSVLTAFKKVFGFDEATAPRLLHIFRHSLLTLVGTPGASLSSVQRLLVDANYRKTMVARVENTAVREFWLSEFNRWSDRNRTEYIASLQNKLGAFTSNERLQAILCATEQGIDLRSVLDDSRILLCNLSKGTVGHDASTLLGSLLLSSLQLSAMSRADVPEADRSDATIVIDEFHSFLAEGNSTMADALAESRKYRTSYVLATQMLEQLDSQTLAGVLGNCGSTLCMTVGPRDAETLAELLGHDLTPQDLMQIPQYHGYLRLLIDGAASTFSMTTLPPPRLTQRRADIIRRVSRQRFAGSSAPVA